MIEFINMLSLYIGYIIVYSILGAVIFPCYCKFINYKTVSPLITLFMSVICGPISIIIIVVMVIIDMKKKS